MNTKITIQKLFFELKRHIFTKFGIFIFGYSIILLFYWRHLIAAVALVDLTTIFLVTFYYALIFAISFKISEILAYIFQKAKYETFFFTALLCIQLVLLALYALYVKNDSRISVFHEEMKIAPDTGQIGVSGEVNQCHLSMMQKDWERGYRECLSAANEGNSEAQTNLAYLYFKGLGPLQYEKRRGGPRKIWKFFVKEVLNLQETPKMSETDAKNNARRLFQMAADKGFPAAQYNLGIFYMGYNSPYPKIGEKDYVKEDEDAAKYIRLAAMQGDAEAIYNLAVMHDQGRGVRQDRDYADLLYKTSASKGFALAKNVVWLNGI